VKVFGTPLYRFTVPKGAFFPAPTIDSAVLSITDIHSPFKSRTDEAFFFEVLHAGFAHKRKQLAGNLAEIAAPEKILDALEKANLDRAVRAEDVPLSTWKILVDFLKD
jgi:16S rRNA (adenine1518-N6/adenine1519-N6)-dimethyltransferase